MYYIMITNRIVLKIYLWKYFLFATIAFFTIGNIKESFFGDAREAIILFLIIILAIPNNLFINNKIIKKL